MDADRAVKLLEAASTASALPSELLDTLRPVLSSLLAHQSHAVLSDKRTPLSDATRGPLLRAIKRVTTGGGGLRWQRWVDLAVAYGEQNASAVKVVLEASAKADDGKELAGWELGGVRSFEEMLATLSSSSSMASDERLERIGRLARCLSAVSAASPILALPLARSPTVLRSCIELYDSVILPLSASTIQFTGSFAFTRLRLAFVRTVSTLLDVGYLDRLSRPASVASDPRSIVDHVTGLLPSSHRPASHPVDGTLKSLRDLSLLGDLEFHTAFADKLRRLADRLPPNAGGLGLRELAQTAQAAAPTGTTDGRSDFSELRPSSQSTGKGKGRAAEDVQDDDEGIAVLLSRLREVLPDVDESSVADAYRRDPSLRTGQPDVVEKVLAAALDGTLDSLGKPEIAPRAEPRVERRNVFGETMEAGLLQRGKASKNADAALADKSHLTDAVRRLIITRAEAESSDEEGDGPDTNARPPLFGFDDEEDAGRKVIDIFDSDYEDPDLGPMPTPAARRVASSSSEDEASEDETPQRAGGDGVSPAVEKVLHRAYLEHVGVFEKRARRTKERQELKDKTGGMADDLLESWKAMFDRDPKRDKILARYEFSGNRALPSSTDDPKPPESSGQSSSTARGGGRGGARGGGGRGRGGERGRGRGRGGGGKAAHDRRVRGHDKKMAKMGV